MYTYRQYVDSEGGSFDSYGLEKLIKNGCPVFVSKWGVGKKSMAQDAVDFTVAEEFLDFLEEHQISWLV